MKMTLPEDVSYIIGTLEKAGHQAYAVGGCVRDVMLGRKPKDWDITTSAKPNEIKAQFKRTVDTGIKHGTVTVLIGGTGYEVTTYRIDGEYEDGRHPKSVEFTDKLSLDLMRRDFTINAMAYSDRRGLVDEFGGARDVKDGIIRCVGDARLRFGEDALRMLRAVRFSGQLGFKIEEETGRAITEMAQSIQKISAERIREELSKLVVSKNSGQIREAYRMGMSRYFLPELDGMMEVGQKNVHHIYTVGEHCVRCVEAMNSFFEGGAEEKSRGCAPSGFFDRIEAAAAAFDDGDRLILCLTMLLHDVAKPSVMTVDEFGTGHFYGHPQKGEAMAGNILKRLAFDGRTVSFVKKLIRHHDRRLGKDPKAVRQTAAEIGRDAMPMLFLVQCADILSQNPSTFEEKFARLDAAMNEFDAAISSGAPLSIRELKVSGKDIMDAGVSPGPELGEILRELLEIVLEDPKKNEKEALMGYVRGLRRK